MERDKKYSADLKRLHFGGQGEQRSSNPSESCRLPWVWLDPQGTAQGHKPGILTEQQSEKPQGLTINRGFLCRPRPRSFFMVTPGLQPSYSQDRAFNRTNLCANTHIPSSYQPWRRLSTLLWHLLWRSQGHAFCSIQTSLAIQGLFIGHLKTEHSFLWVQENTAVHNV